jgi:hypothetical protein
VAKGGTVTLFNDGKKDGVGRVEQSVPMLFPGMKPATSGRKPDRRFHPAMSLKITGYRQAELDAD